MTTTISYHREAWKVSCCAAALPCLGGCCAWKSGVVLAVHGYHRVCQVLSVVRAEQEGCLTHNEEFVLNVKGHTSTA